MRLQNDRVHFRHFGRVDRLMTLKGNRAVFEGAVCDKEARREFGTSFEVNFEKHVNGMCH